MKTKVDQKRIDQFRTEVAAYLPDGWLASECFLMSLSGNHSPTLIMVHRKGWTYEELLQIPKLDRPSWKSMWLEESKRIAKELHNKLAAFRYKVSRDGSSLYITIP